MRSAIAEAVREKQRAREAALTPSQRVRLALKLGERDLRVLASGQGLTLREAWLLRRRTSQAGRTPSKAMDPTEP